MLASAVNLTACASGRSRFSSTARRTRWRSARRRSDETRQAGEVSIQPSAGSKRRGEPAGEPRLQEGERLKAAAAEQTASRGRTCKGTGRRTPQRPRSTRASRTPRCDRRSARGIPRSETSDRKGGQQLSPELGLRRPGAWSAQAFAVLNALFGPVATSPISRTVRVRPATRCSRGSLGIDSTHRDAVHPLRHRVIFSIRGDPLSRSRTFA